MTDRHTVDTITDDALDKLYDALDGAYRERAHLVALLAAMTEGAVIAPAHDVEVPGWQIAYLKLGGWQASWHIAPRDAGLFRGVDHVDVDDPRAQWDGHSTDAKYARIRNHTRVREMNRRLRRMAGKTQAPGEPIVQTTKYTVNCLPADGFDSDVFELTVEFRGAGRWGVYRNAHCCLGADGTWSYGYAWRDGAQEPSSDEEWTEYHAGREAWLDAHRFDEETALRLAKEHAPKVTVNGITVREALSRLTVEATPAREA